VLLQLLMLPTRKLPHFLRAGARLAQSLQEMLAELLRLPTQRLPTLQLPTLQLARLLLRLLPLRLLTLRLLQRLPTLQLVGLLALRLFC